MNESLLGDDKQSREIEIDILINTIDSDYKHITTETADIVLLKLAQLEVMLTNYETDYGKKYKNKTRFANMWIKIRNKYNSRYFI